MHGDAPPPPETGGGESWADSFRPQSLGDLALHPGKVKAVQRWLQDALVAHRTFNEAPEGDPSCASFKPHLLVLCGCSGGGKSTLVQLACREQAVQVLEWSDDLQEGDGAVWRAETPAGGGPPGLLGALEDYATHSAFPTLQLAGGLTTAPGPREPFVPAEAKIILMHSPPFQNARAVDMARCSELFLCFNAPVVVILSEVGGADDMCFAADRALGLQSALRSRLNCQVMYCNPITPLKAAKAMQRIISLVQREEAAARRGSLADGRPRTTVPYRPTDDEIEDIAQACLGDLRHAVVQLQLLCLWKSQLPLSLRPRPVPPSRAPSKGWDPRRRDESFSSLHGVGKLLGAQLDGWGCFGADLDAIMERSEFPLDMSLAFMQFHSVESLHRSSDPSGGDQASVALLEDICLSLDCLAEAGIFWDKQYTVNSNLLEHGGSSSGALESVVSSYPVGYAVAIAARAVGVARGPLSRSWMESVAAKTWVADAPSQSSAVVDLAGNAAIGDDDGRVLSREPRKGGHGKRARTEDEPPRSKGRTGGFLKLTRPKVLDLWRSNKWSRENILLFRDDLICASASLDQLLKHFASTGPPALRGWLTTRELYVTLIPLLRRILEANDSNRSQAMALSQRVRRRMESLFTARTALDSGGEGDPNSCDGLPPSSRPGENCNSNTGRVQNDIENEILLLDDIEEF